MAFVYRRAGRVEDSERSVQALQELATKRYVSPYFLAVSRMGTSDETVLNLLEEAYGDRSFSMIYLDIDPRFDTLRSHSRYRQLLQRMGFRFKT